MKKFLFLPVFLILLISCNKNQNSVSQLSGDWNVKEIRLDGIDYINPGMEFSFDRCKLKKDGYCGVTIKEWSGYKTYGVYNVTHNGKQLNISIPDGLQYYTYHYNIKRLNSNKLILENMDPGSGAYDRIELESLE